MSFGANWNPSFGRHEHYTPPAVPREAVGAIPLEVPLITWQK